MQPNRFFRKHISYSFLQHPPIKSTLLFMHKQLKKKHLNDAEVGFEGFFLPYLGGQGWVLQSWRSCGGRRELTHSLWSAASLVCLFRQITTASCTPGIGQWKERWTKTHERWRTDHSYMLVVSFLLRGMQTHAVLVTHPLFTYYHIHTHMERRKLQADTNIRFLNNSKQWLHLMGQDEHESSAAAA